MTRRAPGWLWPGACILAGALANSAVAEPVSLTEATLTAFVEAGHDPDTLIARLAEIHGDVRVADLVRADDGADNRFAPTGSFGLWLDLSGNGRQVASAGCEGFGPDDLDVLSEVRSHDTSRFAAALKAPAVAGSARRVVCHLYIWEGQVPVAIIEQDATAWGSARIGMFRVDDTAYEIDRLTVVNSALAATGEPWAMTILERIGSDLEALEIELVFEEPATPG